MSTPVARPVSCSSAKGIPKKLFHQHISDACSESTTLGKHITKPRYGSKQFLLMWSPSNGLRLERHGWPLCAQVDDTSSYSWVRHARRLYITCSCTVAPQPVKVSCAAVGGESSNALTDVYMRHVYLKPLGDILRRNGSWKFHLYADDVQLYCLTFEAKIFKWVSQCSSS